MFIYSSYYTRYINIIISIFIFVNIRVLRVRLIKSIIRCLGFSWNKRWKLVFLCLNRIYLFIWDMRLYLKTNFKVVKRLANSDASPPWNHSRNQTNNSLAHDLLFFVSRCQCFHCLFNCVKLYDYNKMFGLVILFKIK